MKSFGSIRVLLLGLLAAFITGEAVENQFTATARATIVNGFVVEIAVVYGGRGYTYPPAVSIVGGGGQGAEARATVENGSVIAIHVTNAGSGYTSPPNVTIASPLLPVLDISAYAGVRIEGAIGRTYTIYFTTNLAPTATWQRLGALVLTNASQVWIDFDSPKAHRRFYRAIETISAAEPANPDPMRLAWVPPGRFVMGSAPTEVDKGPFDEPQTDVTITKGFWIGRYEVTQDEYRALMNSNPSSFTGNGSLPVETVSWYDATNYCSRLTAREREAKRLPTGYEYRLPTDAQWEYACRAGTVTRFSFGDDLSYTNVGDYAWSGLNSGNMTHTVGSKLPNALGLHDMAGNVTEWCMDKFAPALPGGSVQDPAGPTSGIGRVVRGGNWNNRPGVLRSSARDQYGEAGKISYVGFRVALVAE
jgi:formylglycine-generating enzyme required for sulfatase activity